VNKTAGKGSVSLTQAENRKRLDDLKPGGYMACLRGVEPPTFGSGVQHSAHTGGIGGASERDRTSDLLITNQLL